MSQALEKPASFVRCTVAEGGCPLRDTCLRSLTHHETVYAQEADEWVATVVNLWNPAVKSCTAECQAYRSTEKVKCARGFRHLFDRVPKGCYARVRAEVEHVFTNRRFFFFCQKGERLTSPDEQKCIANIFKKYGIEEAPQYDEFVETYNWEN